MIVPRIYPTLPPRYQPAPDSAITIPITDIKWPNGDVTASTIVRAAFSMLVSRETDSTDVMFGMTLAGRQANVPGVEQMEGPTIATVPVRVLIDRSQSVEDFLYQIQGQAVEMTKYEQMGLQHIRRLGNACHFQTLLIIHPAMDNADGTELLFTSDDEETEGDESTGFGSSDTHAITIECSLEDSEFSIRFAYDSTIITDFKVRKLVSQLEHIVRQLVDSKTTNVLSDIESLSPPDSQAIWTWNAAVPEKIDGLVHDLIADVVHMQPHAPAICGWDVEFTYKQLDELSTKLAYHLMDLGAGPGTIVPLCFEKSGITPVAELAVLKIGAAAVVLDTSLPVDRLRTIIDQTNGTILLSSVTSSELAIRISDQKKVVSIDRSVLVLLDLPSSTGRSRELPKVDPSARAYLVFTSGSTGTPKGVMISHANIASHIHHQQKVHNFNPTMRVFAFASHAFDISQSNFFNTLTSGACLCIPSETDRREDIAGSIQRLRANYASLTPSVARILPDEVIASLQQLTVAGEALLPEDAHRFAKLTRLQNSYGPSECTPYSTITTISPAETYSGSIGKGVGLNTWVVDVSTGSMLMPLGSVGELYLEGPLVGCGYLGDAVRTSEAFIEDPVWLLNGTKGHPGRRGRLYKTGDLVRYTDNGELLFVGRKDSQVKIGGQRVELGDIEYQLDRHSSTREGACLLPKSGPCANKLVALFTLKNILPPADTNQNALKVVSKRHQSTLVQEYIASARSLLEDALPSYMVPTIWIAFESLPLNASRKLDRKYLGAWSVDMSKETFAKICFVTTDDEKLSAFRDPETKAERIIQEACSRILNVQMEEINLERSFVANGGDSISAMRLVPQCRAANVVFSLPALLKGKTLAAVAALADVVDSSSLEVSRRQQVYDKLLSLSPVQTWYFTRSPEYTRYINTKDRFYNQGFYVRITKPLSTDVVARALQTIVKNHAMLGARFERGTDDIWRQRIMKPRRDLYYLEHWEVESVANVSATTIERQTEIDLETGPVFTADLFTLPDGTQYLSMVAHHLVIDLVSWRIILDDLETLVTGGSIEPEFPFDTWNELQIEKAKSSDFDPEKVLSTSGSSIDLHFWHFDGNMSNLVSDHQDSSVEVGPDTTSLLLGEANNTFNTEPIDLLLAAVYNAFLRVFHDREGLTIFNEGHGRESWDAANIDLSRTVGWFTTISPIHVSRSNGNSSADIVRFIKDARKMLPSNGWAYFVSRYFNSNGKTAFKEHDSVMEVMFNYHGQFQQLEGEDALFEVADLNGIEEQGPAVQMPSLFDINVSIDSGTTNFSVSWNRHIAHQDLIQTWIKQIGASLESICDDLINREPSTTLCDYEFLSLDYRRLDLLNEEIIPRVREANLDAEIEDIYQCTPMMDGILLSQIRDPSTYNTSVVHEISSATSKPLDINALVGAWQQVVARQPGLRSVFVEGLDSGSVFSQVVLKSCEPSILVFGSEDDEAAMQATQSIPPIDYQQQLKPPHRLTLCLSVKSGKIFAKLEASHVITDGASLVLVLDDWEQAYMGKLSTGNLIETSREFARTLKSSSKMAKTDFWKTKLTGLSTCHFPKLSNDNQTLSPSGEEATVMGRIEGSLFARMQKFCAATSTTPSSLFQSAWALTLARYTGMSSVCFGYLASGRDIPVPGIGDVFGAYANMMVCRVDVNRDLAGHDLVQMVNDQTIQDLDFQHCSLADIQHSLDLPAGQALFNSIISFQKDDDDDDETENVEGQPPRHELSFNEMDGEDPNEYDVTISIVSGKAEVGFSLTHLVSFLTEEQSRRVLSLFQSITTQILSNYSVAEMSTLSDEDVTQVSLWNMPYPTKVDRCVHSLFEEQAELRPEAPAVSSFDQNLTYSELDSLSSALAQRLKSYGVGPEVKVPLCFEKTTWAVVAMLSVLKAGGVCVSLGFSQPKQRLLSIVADVNASVILTTPQYADIFHDTPGLTVMGLTSDIMYSLPTTDVRSCSSVSPSNTAFIVYTSGSTGVPKAHGSRMNIGPSTRALNFAAWTFDVSIGDVFTTLQRGGCVCIISEHDRMSNLAGAINTRQANFASLTPTVAGLLNPTEVPTLKKLSLAGEALPQAVADQWEPHALVYNNYGPAEASIYASCCTPEQRKGQAANIGRPLSTCLWVVDNSNDLVPIGCEGELLIEGPMVARGYLNDEDKTKASFITDPSWAPRTSLPDGDSDKIIPPSGRRMYKTGDLVRMNPDGTFVYIGRKDRQIKIHGQRIELGEIEHHLKTVAPPNVEVAVEPLSSESKIHKGALGAFLNWAKSRSDSDTASQTPGSFSLLSSPSISVELSRIQSELKALLPAHMVPAIFFPLSSFPINTSNKLDRKQLQNILLTASDEDIKRAIASTSKKQLPVTDNEKALQALWSSVLEISPDDIGSDDSFLSLGGDSIMAMKLVLLAPEHGLRLSVFDVLKQPVLSGMAKILQRISEESPAEIPYEPLSLLPPNMQLDSFEPLFKEYNIKKTSVEDILPVTDEQARFLTMTYSSARTMLMYQQWDGVGEPDVKKIRQACRYLTAQIPILRTAFVVKDDSFFQVVLKNVDQKIPFYEIHNDSMDECTERIRQQDLRVTLRFGHVITRFAIIHQTKEQKFRLVVRMSHAQYDGVSLEKLWESFRSFYEDDVEDTDATQSGFAQFLHHQSRLPKAEAIGYWQKVLEGSKLPQFKSHRTHVIRYGEGPSVLKTIPNDKVQSREFTFATVLKAAWAYVFAKNSATDDIVFGTLTHGRDVAKSSRDAFGPCINVVPTRVRFSSEWTIHDLIEAVNQQQVSSMPYEGLGPRELIKNCTNWPRWSYYTSVVMHQNYDDDKSEEENIAVHTHSSDLALGDIDNCELYITTTPGNKVTELQLGFAIDTVTEEMAQEIAADLSDTIVRFFADINSPNPSAILSSQDLRTLPALLPLPEDVNVDQPSKRVNAEMALRAENCPAGIKDALMVSWKNALGTQVIPNIDDTTTFFDKGGDLVAASQLVAHMQRQGHALRIEEFFENPTWCSLGNNPVTAEGYLLPN
ncbi:unnamed protein product, partial [Clonostachys chloroleuca]